MIPGVIIVGAGLAGAGYQVYKGVRHGDWSGVKIGKKEPGYRWDDSDGDFGIETGTPPTDNAHPRKPGNWES